MMNKTGIVLALTLTLTACGGSDSQHESTTSPKASPAITEYAVQSTWWELPQYFDGIPKYNGILGTFTERHLPAAVSCSLGDFAIYSDNTSGDVDVNVLNLDTGLSVTIHTNDLNDAHQNGAIQCVGDKLYAVIATVGTHNNGATYESYDGDEWQQVGENNDKAYPQLHDVNGELLHLYSRYNLTENPYPTRNIYSSCNDERIVDDGLGHYMMSYNDGERIHVVYNDHPDGFVDLRENLWYTHSDDGCDWSEPEQWYSGGLLFLKDLQVINDEITTLVTISDTMNPREAEPKIYKITHHGKEFISDTNHNYTSGTMSANGDVILPNPDIGFYAGGSFEGMSYVNYIRRIHGKDNAYFMVAGTSWLEETDAWVVRVVYE